MDLYSGLVGGVGRFLAEVSSTIECCWLNPPLRIVALMDLYSGLIGGVGRVLAGVSSTIECCWLNPPLRIVALMDLYSRLVGGVGRVLAEVSSTIECCWLNPPLRITIDSLIAKGIRTASAEATPTETLQRTRLDIVVGFVCFG